MIGGITYFHEYAYDLLAENERITAASFDAAIDCAPEAQAPEDHGALEQHGVRERHGVPDAGGRTARSARRRRSTYGFQKLACEYFAQGAWEQYGLPYTICRPFNCVGIGERRALGDKDVPSGNIKLAMSHVVPDLVQKILKGQDPLHILGAGEQVRCYTYGGDLAQGHRARDASIPTATNEDFNLSTPVATTVLELAEADLEEGPRRRASRSATSPTSRSLRRAAARARRRARRSDVLGFEATTPLGQMLDEVIPWIREEIAAG